MQKEPSLNQVFTFAAAFNDGNLVTMTAKPECEAKYKESKVILSDHTVIEKKQEPQSLLFGSMIFSICKESIQIKIMELGKETSIMNDALVIATVDGGIYFYLLKEDKQHSPSCVLPEYFKFDFEMRIKCVKVVKLRLYGRASQPTPCLFVYTFEDYAFVFYDFFFEINTKHMGFRNRMQVLVKRELISKGAIEGKTGKRKINNPILTRIIDHFNV